MIDQRTKEQVLLIEDLRSLSKLGIRFYEVMKEVKFLGRLINFSVGRARMEGTTGTLTQILRFSRAHPLGH